MTRYLHPNKPHSTLTAPEHLSHMNGQAGPNEPESEDQSDIRLVAIPAHPLGLKPSGNRYAAATNARDSIGLLSALPDELIVQLLDYFCSRTLLSFGATCRALYAFARIEDLWKNLFIENLPIRFTWHGTWRSTYLDLPPFQPNTIDCRNLFSDILYRPFQCAYIPLNLYTLNIPPQNQIPRLEDLTPDDFHTYWTSKPFIVTSPIKTWPIFRTWSTSTLLLSHGPTVFRAESVDWPLSTYLSYCSTTTDESPIYLFDRGFVEKMNLTVSPTSTPNADYWPPSCFNQDLFSVLGPARPAHRWLIIGPARSGSTFHKDPNATSAWNAVLQGSKYWIMFPPSSAQPPPGVFVSQDQSEVTSPLSIAEWLLTFHEEARRTRGCMEGVCGEGEVLHVPSGWWHLVVNLSEAVAITQNFVPRGHLGKVLDFLKNRPDQVTGFRKDVADPYQLFIDKLKEAHLEILEQALKEMSLDDQPPKKRKWDELVKNGNEEKNGRNGGFSFGFGDGDDEDIP